MSFEIWFFNYSTSVRLPTGKATLNKAADRLEIVSSERRSEEMHVSRIANPSLPGRFIYNWSLQDMNHFAGVVGAIPQSDYDKLATVLKALEPSSLVETYNVLAQHWPDAVYKISA
ncbi:MAG: hypothetical protein LBV12_11840 [Puniceicoccales bacterium]|jgi:hypothetical protein|nr:hypothetical protein [Puniceicoccales bacterium]